jgi:hypothetical protein
VHVTLVVNEATEQCGRVPRLSLRLTRDDGWTKSRQVPPNGTLPARYGCSTTSGMLVLIIWRRAVDMDDREKVRRLFSKLEGRLNEREREVVSLCVLHGYTRPEAAKLLNVPEPALQKVTDGAMKKIGGVVASVSACGCGDEWARLMRAYAFSAIEDEREYKRAAEHVEECARQPPVGDLPAGDVAA